MNNNRRELARIVYKHTGNEVMLNEILGGIAGFFGNILNPGGIFTGLGAGIDEEAVKSAASPAAWILFKAMAGPGTDEAAIERVFSQYKDLRQIAQLADEYDRLIAALIKEKSGIGTAIKKVGLGALRGSLLGVGVGYAGSKIAKKVMVSQYDQFMNKNMPETMKKILAQAQKSVAATGVMASLAKVPSALEKKVGVEEGATAGTLIDLVTKDADLPPDEAKVLANVLQKEVGNKKIDIRAISDDAKIKIATAVGIPAALRANPKVANIFKQAGVDPVASADKLVKADTPAGMKAMAKDGALFGALFGGVDVAMNWMTNYLYDDDLATWLEDDGMDDYANLVRQARSASGGRLMAGKTYIKNGELKNVIREEVIRAEKKRRQKLKESKGRKGKGKTITTTKRAIREAMVEQRRVGLLNESIMSKFTNFMRSVADLGGMVSGTNDVENVQNMATPDAWMIFKALVGPGTDETTVSEILQKRASDLKALYAEFNRLIEALIAERSSVTGSIKKMGSMALAGTAIGATMGAVSGVVHSRQQDSAAKGIAAANKATAAIKQGSSLEDAQALGKQAAQDAGIGAMGHAKVAGKSAAALAAAGTLAGLGVSGLNQLWRWIQNNIQNQDLIWYLREDGMDDQADLVEYAITGNAPDRGVVPESFQRAKKKRMIRGILRKNGIRV